MKSHKEHSSLHGGAEDWEIQSNIARSGSERALRKAVVAFRRRIGRVKGRGSGSSNVVEAIASASRYKRYQNHGKRHRQDTEGM